jgi:NADH:ubiquinone oxidoreductase subunit C
MTTTTAPETTPEPTPPPPNLAELLGIEGARYLVTKDGFDNVIVPRASFALAATKMRDAQGYVRFIDLTCVDHVENERKVAREGGRFEIALLVYNMDTHVWARVQTFTDDVVPSVTPVYVGAHNYEREVYDLFGVTFDGHPALTRILLPDAWVGFPLRRDAEAPTEQVDFTVTRALYNT